MLILIKAYNRKRVIHPGVRGGKYWIDKQGNVRYGIAGIHDLNSVKKASELFEKNIKYYTGMAYNIAMKAGRKPEYYDGQPVGEMADMLAAGRLAAIKAYDEYHRTKPKNIDLGQMMRKRVSAAMWSTVVKLGLQVNKSHNDRRNLKIINDFKDRYFVRYGYYPDNDTVAENIKEKVVLPNNKNITNDKIKILINRLESDVIISQDYGDLAAEEQQTVELPQLDQLMRPIVALKNKGEISDIGYKIIEMYLGIGKYKKPRGWQEIGNKLNLSRKTVYWHFRKNADILKPYFERYRGLLEKSISEERIREFIKEILGLNDIFQKSIHFIFKSHVKGYIKTTKTGKIVNVREYENRKTKKLNMIKDVDNEKTLKNNIKIIERKNYNTKKIISDKGYTLHTYNKIPKDIKFKSRYVNDMNQNLCGGWFINFDYDEDEFILKRVLQHFKPMGILIFKNNKDMKQLLERYKIDRNKFDIIVDKNKDNIELRISVKGKMKDLFDLKTLKEDYKKYGINININKVANKEIKDYGKNWDAQDSKIEYWETGLILGYPIENTISIYNQ